MASMKAGDSVLSASALPTLSCGWEASVSVRAILRFKGTPRLRAPAGLLLGQAPLLMC